MASTVQIHDVFVTGGSGYMGSRLIPLLLDGGHQVTALVRNQSVKKLPPNCQPVIGNVLERSSFMHAVSPCDTFVHLVGVSHPSPAKAQQFKEIDLVATREAVAAAAAMGVRHFVYVSVAHPAPAMRAYVEVRIECERIIQSSGMAATILRPWYVLGPGHRWPNMLIPMYWLAGQIPSTRESARRLGLVTIDQMVRSLRIAVEHPAEGTRVLTVPEIRES